MIQPQMRIIKSDDSFSTFIATGTDKIRSGFGNGDCVYLDFKNKVFAVADGTERYSFASRQLLEKIRTELSLGTLPDNEEEWTDFFNTVYSGQVYHYKTTLSGIAIKEDGEYIKAYIFHGGDSVVMVVDEETGTILYQTAPNMSFAGRSKTIGNVIQISLRRKHSRIIIATDGLTDLLKHYFKEISIERLPSEFFKYPIEDIAERILNDLNKFNASVEYDDIGLIVINPFNVDRGNDVSVIMGGTSPQNEKQYRHLHGALKKDWIAEDDWSDNREELLISGIII